MGRFVRLNGAATRLSAGALAASPLVGAWQAGPRGDNTSLLMRR